MYMYTLYIIVMTPDDCQFTRLLIKESVTFVARLCVF